MYFYMYWVDKSYETESGEVDSYMWANKMLVTCQDIQPHGVECSYLSQNGLKVLTFKCLESSK